MCNHWMIHYRLYISTTDFNYKISATGHYVKLLRTKLYDKREGSISHRELSIYAYTFQHHLHIEQIFLCCSDIPELLVPFVISLIEGGVTYKKEVITLEALRSQTRPRKPLRKINVTNYYRYVPFVVIIIRSFLHLKLVIGFVTRATRRMRHVEQELQTISEH